MLILRYAIIGCGRISPNHISAAIDNNLEIVGLCDIKEDMAVEKANKFHLTGKVNLYTDYKKMLATEQPELVAIATESGEHAKIALYCISQGCNLIIEKPIALSLTDADAIIAASIEKSVVVSACHQNRFNKAIQKIRGAIDENRFGRLLHGAAHIRWNRGKDYYIQAPWRGTWEQDGGALMNQCIHNIDLLRWMMGSDIKEVVAYTDNLNHNYIDAEDLGMAIVKFTNGSYGLIEGTTNIYPQNLEETLYIFGSQGTVKAGGKSVNVIEEWSLADEKECTATIKQEHSENPDNVYGFGHSSLYADVIKAIKTGNQPLCDAVAGRQALELVLAIYKSAAEGRTVKLPLSECSTMEFKGRFK